MKYYEIVFLVHPDQSDQVPAMTKHIVSIVKDTGGKIHRNEDWKRRQLAYPIEKVHKAHYLLMNVKCSLEAMNQIREYFRFNEAVLRNLILDVGRAITVPSPIKPVEFLDDDETDPAKAERKHEQASRDKRPIEADVAVEAEADAAVETEAEDKAEVEDNEDVDRQNIAKKKATKTTDTPVAEVTAS